MSLSEVANAVNGTQSGSDVLIRGVSTDTRTLTPGELFVALVGPHFDGHSFLSEAEDKQAAGALISHTAATSLPTVMVQDTQAALGQLAAHWRTRFDIPLVAVTGSNGKTTVKEMVGAILECRAMGLMTEGNLNNEIGVPLSLCRLRQGHRFAVIELGMNHPGEIDYLTHLTKPTVAVITNAGAAHLEGVGDVAAVAAAKGEIFNGLAADGVAVINADDVYADLWRRLAGTRRRLEFGFDNPADVNARFTPATQASEVQLHTPLGEVEFVLPVPGRHNVANAAAAVAAAIAAGCDLTAIAQALSGFQPVAGRLMVRRGIHGAVVYDDTYNANPASVQAGLEVLAMARGKRMLVLGDMAELGSQAESLHNEAGVAARGLAIDHLWALGPLAAAAAVAFGDGGRHFSSHAQLIDALTEALHKDWYVLVKGSRRMQMEKIVAGISAHNGTGH